MTMMLTPDYWLKIPGGDFQTGLSDAKRDLIRANFTQHLEMLSEETQTLLIGALRKHYSFADRPDSDRNKLLDLQHRLEDRGTTRDQRAELVKQKREIIRSTYGKLKSGVFSEEESTLLSIYLRTIEPPLLDDLEDLELGGLKPSLKDIAPPGTYHLDEFFIARFPITQRQYHWFRDGAPIKELPGALDEPETSKVEIGGVEKEVYGRRTAAVQIDEALRFCEELNARLPTAMEWEKAARGEDGWLYPWGDEWDPEAGFFYTGQFSASKKSMRLNAVDAFPKGESPFGVWSMAGGLPELVSGASPPDRGEWDFKESRLKVTIKGCHPRETSEALAWFHHIVVLAGRGEWVSLRPVLDEWPRQQWRGH